MPAPQPDERPRSLRFRAYELLEGGARTNLASRIIDLSLTVLIIVNVTAVALASVDSLYRRHETLFDNLELFSVTVFTIEYVMRLWAAPEHLALSRRGAGAARLRFALTPMMLIDLLAILPALTFYLVGGDLRIVRVFRVLRLLKLVRYSPAIATLWSVLHSERRALFAALVIMLCLLMLTSGLMYLIEREAQPEHFSSIPSAMWWSLATLSTVGYGDVVPITPLGKLFGGFVAILGVAMYGLPIAIVASGFANEFYRRDFVVSWGMVATIPLFSKLAPKTIEHLAKLLHARRVPAGYRLMRRGDPSDCFYVIIDGSVRVMMPDKTYSLGAGDYFGVVSLLYNIDRPATVETETECRLVMLSNLEFEQLIDLEPELGEELHQVAQTRAREGGLALT